MSAGRSFHDYQPVMNSAQVAQMLGNTNIKSIQVAVRASRTPAPRLLGARKYWFLQDEIVEWLRLDANRVTPEPSDIRLRLP